MVKLFALDVDGVLTDGTLHYSADGEVLKIFHVEDGLGLKLLAKLGIEVAVISGRQSAALERRLDDLGIRRRRLKASDKVAALNDICADTGLTLSDCAFMGDDLVDLAVMKAVKLAIAPANAVPEVKAIAHHITWRSGGQGAARDACEHLAGLAGTSLAALFDGKATN